MLIANDGTGSTERGSYNVKVLRKNALPTNPGTQWLKAPVTRIGRVTNYPRQAYNVWRLIARALSSAFPEEKL